MTEIDVASSAPAPAKTYPICTACGSSDVVKDAWASWNPETGLWELMEVFDYSFCRACEQSAELDWIETSASETTVDKTAMIRRLNDALRKGETQVAQQSLQPVVGVQLQLLSDDALEVLVGRFPVAAVGLHHSQFVGLAPIARIEFGAIARSAVPRSIG